MACRNQEFSKLFTGCDSNLFDCALLYRSCVCMISVAGEDDSLESVAVGALFKLDFASFQPQARAASIITWPCLRDCRSRSRDRRYTPRSRSRSRYVGAGPFDYFRSPNYLLRCTRKRSGSRDRRRDTVDPIVSTTLITSYVFVWCLRKKVY